MMSTILRILGLGGRPMYKIVKGGPQTVKEIQKKFPNSRVIKNPSPSIIAQAKPFTPISGAGSRSIPSPAQQAERASRLKSTRPSLKKQRVIQPIQGAGSRGKPSSVQQAEQAAQAARMPKPQASTGRTTVRADRKPVRADRKPVRAESKPVRAQRPALKADPKTINAQRAATARKIKEVAERSLRRKNPVVSGRRTSPVRAGSSRLTKQQRAAILGGTGAAILAGLIPDNRNKTSKAETDTTLPASSTAPRKRTPFKTPKPKLASPGPVGPVRRGGAQKNIDAGGNTGFGIKGNQFVGGPEERAVMMKYYGGTGSAAAKAALEGKQGILKSKGMDALKKELQEARAKRLARTTTKASGGYVSKSKNLKRSKPMTPKKSGEIKKQNKNIGAGPNVGFGPKGNIFPSNSKEREDLMKMYGGTGSKAGSSTKFKKGGKVVSKKKKSAPKKTEVVARQQRGWGKARKPKR